MDIPLTQDGVIASSDQLPVFPRVVTQILATLDDPHASLNVLAQYIEHDPVITARVLALTNRAATHRATGAPVSDVFTAISLIGLAQVRQTALLACLAGFLDTVAPIAKRHYFWEHSVVVGVGCVELAPHATRPTPVDAALIAGLLHDIGQLWLARFKGDAFRRACTDSQLNNIGIEVSEKTIFGVDHAQIGAWLAGSWGLTENIVNAIAGHHAPDTLADEPLVAVVHVAEVLSNALDITGNAESRVTTVSEPCCAMLGLDWGEDSRQLFGRIEARSHHAMGFLR